MSKRPFQIDDIILNKKQNLRGRLVAYLPSGSIKVACAGFYHNWNRADCVRIVKRKAREIWIEYVSHDEIYCFDGPGEGRTLWREVREK